MLVEKLKSEGLTLKPDGENLIVSGKLNDEQRQFIKAHKPAILAELQPGHPRIAPKLEAMIHRMAAYWNYSEDDLSLALELAEADPKGWERLCLADGKRKG